MTYICLPDVAVFLDEMRGGISRRMYPLTHYDPPWPLRDAVTDAGGKWTCDLRAEKVFDTLRIPFHGGQIVIDRPWLWGNHSAGYCGEPIQALDEQVQECLTGLLQKEREGMFEALRDVRGDIPAEELYAICRI